MKTLIYIPVIAMIMVSCNKNDSKTLTPEEQTALQIEQMKLELEEQKLEIMKQKTIDSMQMINELGTPMSITAAPAPAAVEKQKVVYRNSPRRTTAASTANQNTSQTAQTPSTTTEKKGWSNTAKGAVIGAGAGAIGGAIINKKKPAQGAVIGGIIGAAAGAGTGAIIDKKKKEEQNASQ